MVSPEGFRDLRHGCLLSNTKAAARYLGVCERTIRHWDTGRNRVPWSVVRLLRLLRCGDLGALADEWDGWTLNRPSGAKRPAWLLRASPPPPPTLLPPKRAATPESTARPAAAPAHPARPRFAPV